MTLEESIKEFTHPLGNQAIAILRHIVASGAYVPGDEYPDYDQCFFCWHQDTHQPDCPYIAARNLLEEIDYERSNPKIS